MTKRKICIIGICLLVALYLWGLRTCAEPGCPYQIGILKPFSKYCTYDECGNKFCGNKTFSYTAFCEKCYEKAR